MNADFVAGSGNAAPRRIARGILSASPDTKKVPLFQMHSAQAGVLTCESRVVIR